MVHSSAAALVDSSTVSKNGIAGICLAAGRAVLTQNRLTANGQVGLCVIDNSAASIKDNDLRENGVWSIFVARCSANQVSAVNNCVDPRPVKLPVAADDADDRHPNIPRELLFSTSPHDEPFLDQDSCYNADRNATTCAPSSRDQIGGQSTNEEDEHAFGAINGEDASENAEESATWTAR
jgi:hypothetical protein